MASEKIIDRVKKLLAMSKDASSPHEAGIALSRAKKLIEQHQLDEEKLLEQDKKELRAIRRRLVDWGYANYSKIPIWLQMISSSVGKLYDCEIILSLDRTLGQMRPFTVTGVGLEEDIEVTRLALAFVLKQVNAEYEKAKIDYSRTGAGQIDAVSFYEGAAQRISTRISDIQRERQMQEDLAKMARMVEGSPESKSGALAVLKKEIIVQTYPELEKLFTPEVKKSNRDTDFLSFMMGDNAGKKAQLSNTLG